MAGVKVNIYADGSCLGNPGPGGWAYIIEHISSGQELKDSGGTKSTTNNIMEMTAVIEAVKRLTVPCDINLVLDSNYVGKGLTEWIKGWKRNNWKTAKKKPVANKDLWIELDELLSKHTFTFEHVYGHTGHKQNEEVDKMARMEAKKF